MGIPITVNTVLYLLLGAWATGQVVLIAYFGWAYLAYYRYLFRRLASDPPQQDASGQGTPVDLQRWMEGEWRIEQADPAMEQLPRTVWRRMRYAIAWLVLLPILVVVGMELIISGSPTR